MDDCRGFGRSGPNESGDGAYWAYMARRSERLSRMMTAFRKTHGLSPCELLVLLAAGGLNIQAHASGLPLFVSASSRDVSAATGLTPSQTRAIFRSLQSKGVLVRACRGWVVANPHAWLDLAETLV